MVFIFRIFCTLENNAGLSTELKNAYYVQRFYQQVHVYWYLLRFVRFYTYDVLSVSKMGRNSYRVAEKVTSASTIEISLRKTQLFCQKKLNVRIGFKI